MCETRRDLRCNRKRRIENRGYRAGLHRRVSSSELPNARTQSPPCSSEAHTRAGIIPLGRIGARIAAPKVGVVSGLLLFGCGGCLCRNPENSRKKLKAQ